MLQVVIAKTFYLLVVLQNGEAYEIDYNLTQEDCTVATIAYEKVDVLNSKYSCIAEN